eukprot:gene16970-20188_t
MPPVLSTPLKIKRVTLNVMSMTDAGTVVVDMVAWYVDLVTMDLKFTDDLYYYQSVACPDYNCARNSTAPDCSCDYASVSHCGQTMSANAGACPPCPQQVQNMVTGEMVPLCDPVSAPWTQIEANKLYRFTMDSDTQHVINLRYKANASICEGLRVVGSGEQGSYGIHFNRQTTGLGRQTPAGSPYMQYVINICPTDNSDWAMMPSWTDDTYFISIVSMDSSPVNMTFILYTYDISPPAPANAPKCAPVFSSHKCINDGEAINGQGDGEVGSYYTFLVDRPMVVQFSCPTLNQDIDFFISDDEANQFPTFQSYKWGYMKAFDDVATLALDPIGPGQPRVLYIGIIPYYSSNFTCVVTTKGRNILHAVLDDNVFGGTFALAGTTRFVYPDGSYQRYNSWADTDRFYALYPRVHNNPLWPIPNLLFDPNVESNFFKDIFFVDPTNPPINATYQAAFILSYTNENTKTVFSDFQTIASSQLEFLNVLVDRNGKPIIGSFPFQVGNISCDYDEFQSTLAIINDYESQLSKSTDDFGAVSSLRYSLDVFTLRDSWVGCNNRANSLLEIETKSVTTLTTNCPYASTDVEFSTDPCCNSTMTFFQCCTPRLVTVNTSSFIGVHKDLVSQQCSSYDCTVSLLSDYYTSIADVSSCMMPAEETNQAQLEITNNLRACKSVYDRIDCTTSKDCDGAPCNMFTRRCEPPFAELDRKYLRCTLRNMSALTIYFLQYNLQIPASNDTVFFEALYQAFLQPDCTYYSGLSYRTSYLWESQYGAIQGRCYPSPLCLDVTCQTEHDVCYDGYVGGFSWIPYQFDEESCKDRRLCPHLGCTGADPTCQTNCLSTPNYCGYCTNNDTYCHNFKTLDTKTKCLDDNDIVCLLPNGDYKLGLTKDDCENQGVCSQNCGYKCTGYVGCLVDKVDQTACTKLANTTWMPDLSICKVNVNRTACQLRKYIYEDCASRKTSECYSPYGTDPLLQNLCSAVEVPCLTESTCLKTGGSCSDSFFFDEDSMPRHPADTSIAAYPTRLGKCVHGHFAYKSNWNQPTCDFDTENDSPKGCFTNVPKVYTEAACKARGPQYTWWPPATSMETCESQMGCSILDKSVDNVPNNYRFNEMTQEQCGGCSTNTSDHEYKPMFAWKRGTWMPGVPVHPEWRPTAYVPTAVYQPAFSHNEYARALQKAYFNRVADQLKSNALCRMERVEENLGAVTCSCSGPGGAQCFTNSAILLGQTKACNNERSSYRFSFGVIYFDPLSVPYTCVNVIISQVSRQLFKATSAPTLSSNFVSYARPDAYAITNTKGAIIGSILFDGVRVKAEGVSFYALCLLASSSSSSSKYSVLDIAYEDPVTSKLIPLDSSPYIEQSGQDTLICTKITVINSTATFFPIARLADWEAKNKEPFDRTATAILYTLAVIFLGTSLWGISQLFIVVVKRSRGLHELKLVHLLILTITIFVTIRTIYFFILPSGKLSQSPIADYIMVVLPTFIYFTAFTIIIVLWYMVIKAKSHRNFLSRLAMMIGAINVVFYLLFIVIVLVFHFTERIPTNDCGGRIQLPVSNTTPQRVVSIVYAVVQAVISLIIGAAFVYLGGSLYFMMKFKKIANSNETNDNHQRRVFIVTHACSIGFILHCAFVLVLVGAEPSNITFSFIGLIITEIIPSVSILYSYNQGALTGIKQTTNTLNLPYVDEGFTSSNLNQSSSTMMSSSSPIVHSLESSFNFSLGSNGKVESQSGAVKGNDSNF